MTIYRLKYRIESKEQENYETYYEGTIEVNSKDELKSQMNCIYKFHYKKANVFFMECEVTETEYDLTEFGLLKWVNGDALPIDFEE